MAACPFCHVRDNPHEGVVATSKHALAVMDKHPVVKGHCLVITAKHYDSLLAVPDAELLDLLKLAVRVEKALLASGFGGGVDLRQHYRPFLEESELVVRHVHLHLVPRKEGDEIFRKAGLRELALRTSPPEKDLFAAAGQIRKALK